MKVILIGKPTPGGYLSQQALNFLKEKGFKDTELNEQYPAIDYLKRNDILLVEAVEKYNSEMPYLEILEVPVGKYKILSIFNGQEGTTTEVIIKEGCYWQTSTKLNEITVQADGDVNKLDISVHLGNGLKRAGIDDIYKITKLTRPELQAKCGLGRKGLYELDTVMNELDLKFAGE